MTDAPSWINKGHNPLPDWLEPHKAGRREANGTFLIKTVPGDIWTIGKEKVQVRVLVGNIVILRDGIAFTCPASEVKERLAALELAAAPPPDRGAQQRTKCEADVADMRDDTDDISARIRSAASGCSSEDRITFPQQVRAKGRTSAAQPKQPKQPHAPSKPAAAKPDRSRTFPPPKGSRPTIEWIHIDRLSLDADYQRSTDNQASQRLIKSIAAGFDWRLCTPLVISRRDADKLVVIDGQHRTLAARMRPDLPDLPCCVFTFASVEEEAKMFIAMNRSRKAMNRLDDFHAALAAGDGEAHQVRQLVEDAGLTIARNTASASWKPGEIAFTASIASTLKKQGVEVAGTALRSIAEAFPDQKVVHAGSIFLGLVKALAHPPAGLDRDRLFRALLKYTAEEWGSFVAGLKGGDTRASAIRDALMMAYEETGAA